MKKTFIIKVYAKNDNLESIEKCNKIYLKLNKIPFK